MTVTEIATVVISGLAIVIAVVNSLVVQRWTDRRELAKWRRDALLAATSELAQLSYSRNKGLIEAFDAVLMPFSDGIDPFDTDDDGAHRNSPVMLI